jgi:hypothetical protein
MPPKKANRPCPYGSYWGLYFHVDWASMDEKERSDISLLVKACTFVFQKAPGILHPVRFGYFQVLIAMETSFRLTWAQAPPVSAKMRCSFFPFGAFAELCG